MTDVAEITPYTPNNKTINFTLNAGYPYANRGYWLLGGCTGSSPGIRLPVSGLILPVNYDPLTEILIGLGFGQGQLDGQGQATELLDLTAITPQIPDHTTLTFAFCTTGPSWDFVSNPVNVHVHSLDYSYDDGTTEMALGINPGGELCPRDTILSIRTVSLRVRTSTSSSLSSRGIPS